MDLKSHCKYVIRSLIDRPMHPAHSRSKFVPLTSNPEIQQSKLLHALLSMWCQTIFQTLWLDLGKLNEVWGNRVTQFSISWFASSAKKVEEIRYFCNNSVWRWEDIWSRGMTVRQFQIFHSEAIPIKLPPIVKVTCFCAEREIWGWRKIWKNAQREFLGMGRLFFRTEYF